MRKWKKVLCFILCFTLCFGLIIPQPVFAGVTSTVYHVVEKGFAYLVMGVATGLVKLIVEPLGLSIQAMIAQGGDSAHQPEKNNAYDLTTIAINDKGDKISGLFNDVITKWYPPLIKLAIVTFMLGILYIGIVALFSTATAKRYEYMEKLKAWGMGLLLLFAFNYIMVYVVKTNNYIASFFLTVSGVYDQKPTTDPADPTTTPTTTPTTSTSKNVRNLVYYINLHRHFTLGKHDPYAKNPAEYPVTRENNDPVKDLKNGKQIKFNLYLEKDKQSKKEAAQRMFSSKISEFAYMKEYNGVRKLWVAPVMSVLSNKSDEREFVPGSSDEELPYMDYYYVEPPDFSNDPGALWGDYDRDVYVKTRAMIDSKTLERIYSKDVVNDDIFKIVRWTVGLGAYHSEGKIDDPTFGVVGSNIDDKNADGSSKTSGSWLEPKDPLLKALYKAFTENDGSIGDAIVYLAAVFQTVWFFFIYFIRLFIISFLILIFPVVMAVYCLDRLDDNKSVVFGEWWKHFTANVFTNSIHALTYGIIFSVILNEKATYGSVVKVIALFFLMPANRLARQIFGVSQGAGADLAGVGAVMGGASLLKNIASSSGKGKASGSKGKSTSEDSGINGSGSKGGSNIDFPNSMGKKLGGVAGGATKKLAKLSAGAAAATFVAATGGGMRDIGGMATAGFNAMGTTLDRTKNVAVGAYNIGKTGKEKLGNRKMAQAIKNSGDSQKKRMRYTADKRVAQQYNASTGNWDTLQEQKGDYSHINSSDKELDFGFETQNGHIKDNTMKLSEASVDNLAKEHMEDDQRVLDDSRDAFAASFHGISPDIERQIRGMDTTSADDIRKITRMIDDHVATVDPTFDSGTAKATLASIREGGTAFRKKSNEFKNNIRTTNARAGANQIVSDFSMHDKTLSKAQRQRYTGPKLVNVRDI